MELNLLSVNLIKENYRVHSPHWLADMLVLAGGGVGGPEESDDGNIDMTTIRQVAPVTQYTPLLCPGHTHCLIALSSEQHQQNYNTTLQIQS